MISFAFRCVKYSPRIAEKKSLDMRDGNGHNAIMINTYKSYILNMFYEIMQKHRAKEECLEEGKYRI
jgi:hypothetical protein